MKKEIDSWFDKPFIQVYLDALHRALNNIEKGAEFFEVLNKEEDLLYVEKIALLEAGNQIQDLILQTFKQIYELYKEEK